MALKVPCKARMPLRTCHGAKEGPFREIPLAPMGDGLREHESLSGVFLFSFAQLLCRAGVLYLPIQGMGQ